MTMTASTPPVLAASDKPSTSVSSSKNEFVRKRRLDQEDGQHAEKLVHPRTSSSSVSFLPCHLTMLKSLYGEESPPNQDGLVSEEVWEMIQRYLDQSCEIQTVKKEAAKFKDIHDEAIVHLNTIVQKQQAEQPRTHTRVVFSMTTQQTPLNRHVFSPPYEQVLQSQGKSSMNLIAKLIGGKASVAQIKAKSMAQPYLQVLEAVNGRIEKLKRILDKARTADAATMSTPKSNVEVEIKIRLWQMLAIDLYNSVKED
jgi:hypothetical protein